MTRNIMSWRSIKEMIYKKTFSFPLNYGLTKTGFLLMPVQVGEYALSFIIDTGANLSILDWSVAEQLGDLAEINNESNTMLCIDGNYREIEQTAKIEFQIDNHPFNHTFISESLFDSLIEIELENDVKVHGVLGCDFLLKNKWIIDFERLKIYSTQ